MTVEKQVIEGELVTGNFTLQAQMPNGKSITLSGYIYDKNTKEAVNARIDFMHDVLDRQRTRAEIPELEAKLDQRYKALGQLRDLMASLQKKQSGGSKLSSAEKKQLQDIDTSIQKITEDIEDGKQAIQDAKATAGVS